MSVISKSVEGVEISWTDGTSRTVPLLTGDEITKWWPEVSAAMLEWKEGRGDAIEMPITIVLAAAQRRYPAMTREELEENLDMPTLRKLWQELWALSFLNLQADREPKQ